MRAVLRKINQTPLVTILYFLLLFFLPFQQQYHKALSHLSKIAFKGQFFPFYISDRFLSFYITDILMIGVIFLSIFTLKRPLKDIFWTKSQKYLLIFLGASFVSIVFSSASHQLWPYWRWMQLALPIAMYFILSAQLDMKRAIRICCWILLWTSLFECCIAILQYGYQEIIGLKSLGEYHFHHGNCAQIGMPNHHRWIFDNVFGTQAQAASLLRPFGTFTHTNVLGGFLGMTFFSTAFLFLTTQGWKKSAIGLALILQIFCVTLTFSRAAIIGVFFGFFLLIALVFRLKTSIKALVFWVFLGGVLTGGILHEQLLSRGGIVNSNKVSQGSNEKRIHFQETAIEMAKERPITGHGYNQYLTELPEKSFHFEIQKVHNIYLLILAETGIFGMVAFLGFFASLLFWTWKKGLDLSSACLGVIIVYFLWFGCVDYFWISTQHGRLMLFLISALLASYTLGSQPSKIPARSSRQALPKQGEVY